MARMTPEAEDLARTLVTGSFAAPGEGAPALLEGFANVSVWGSFEGRLLLERSFDGQATWIPVLIDGYGQAAQLAAPGSLRVHEPEPHVWWRLRAETLTTGAALWRISR